MNRFIKTIIIVFGVTAILLLTFKVPKIIAMRHSKFAIPQSYKTIVIGNSLGTVSINDSIIFNWKNLCVSGTNYTQNLPFLRKVLNDNKQIDTVITICSPYSFIRMEDDKLKNQGIQTINNFLYDYAIAEKEDLKGIANNPHLYAAIFCNDLFSALHFSTNSTNEYGFSYQKSNNLNDSTQKWGIKWYDNLLANTDEKIISLDVIFKKRSLQRHALEKIIQLCKENNKTIILLSTPLYNYERWFSCDGFIDYLGTLDDSILIADYQHFEFPDTTYFKDVHHLNGKGGNYFSTYIKEHGLETQRLGDYVREKKAERKHK